MIGLDASKDIEQNIKLCVNNMIALVSTQDEQKIKILSSELSNERKKFLKSKIPANIIRSGIINLVMQYHSSDFGKKEEREIAYLVKALIKNFPLKEVVEVSLSDIKNILNENSPFRTMISFKQKISKDKQYVELYFMLMMINKNVLGIIKGLNTLLGLKNENIENQLKGLSFQNTYSVIFIRDLINELMIKKSNIKDEEVLQNVVNNMKNYYFFHCPKCLDILNVEFEDNIIVSCSRDKLKLIPKTIKDLDFDYNIRCANCNDKIEIYKNDYKCIECAKFFCEKCAEQHKNIEAKNILINVNEIGYICEKHINLYSTFCGLCKQNLCDLCREIHVHKVGQKLYEISEYTIEINKNKKGSTNLNEYILIRLSSMYDLMQNFSYSNLSIKFAIWMLEKSKRIDECKDKNLNFYFDKFYDDNFKKYYDKLIENVLEGKKKFYEYMNKIKQNYAYNNFDIDESYKDLKDIYYDNRTERNIKIHDWLSDIREIFIWKGLINCNLGLNNKINNLDNICKTLKGDIELLQIKIKSLIKSNDIYNSNLMKLVNRYLSDLLIRNIIQRYPLNFKLIRITHKNFYEIAKSFSKSLFKNGSSTFLDNLKNQLDLEYSFNELSENEKGNKIKLFLKIIEDCNSIAFTNPIQIENDAFNVDELNFVLETILYFKFQGNIIAHINISPDDSIKLKKITTIIPKQDNLIDNDDFIFNGNSKEENIIGTPIKDNNNENSINTNSICDISTSNIIISKAGEQIMNSKNNTNVNSMYESTTNGVVNSNLNEINQNHKQIMNNINSSINIVEKIIENIKNNKKDWLEIEDEVSKDTKNKIAEIKGQIIDDFYDISIETKIKINVILDYIFNDDYKSIFKIDSGFY